MLWQNVAFRRADTLHPFFARMRHLIQGKDDVKITCQELCDPVIYADQVFSVFRLFYLGAL